MFQNIGTQTSKGSHLVRNTSTSLTGIVSFRDSRATSVQSIRLVVPTHGVTVSLSRYTGATESCSEQPAPGLMCTTAAI